MSSDSFHLGLAELQWFRESATTVFELPSGFQIDVSNIGLDEFLENPQTCPLRVPHSPPMYEYPSLKISNAEPDTASFQKIVRHTSQDYSWT